MPSPLDGATGERMALDAYYADFEKHFWNSADLGFWKLERQQTFKEPGYGSWEAFARGEWDESLRLLEAGRADMADYHRRIDRHGFVTRRIRVVEEPLSDYMQWELHALRVRDQCGGSIRVISADKVERYEDDGPLPEIYTLGSQVMYEAVYDDQGVLQSGRKFTDPDLVLRCRRFIADLYDEGEPLEGWFDGHVAILPPPPAQAQGWTTGLSTSTGSRARRRHRASYRPHRSTEECTSTTNRLPFLPSYPANSAETYATSSTEPWNHPPGSARVRPGPPGPGSPHAPARTPRYGRRPHAEIIGDVARSSRPAAMFARWRSISSSVASPAATRRPRTWRTVAASRRSQAGDVIGKYASASTPVSPASRSRRGSFRP